MAPNTRERTVPSAITSSIWWVRRGDWGGLPRLTQPGDCNIYLLKGSEFDVLVDCGGSGPISLLETNVRLAGSHPDPIRDVWQTHTHFDHFLGAENRRSGIPETQFRLSAIALEFLERKNYQLIGSFHPPRPKGFRMPARVSALRHGRNSSNARRSR